MDESKLENRLTKLEEAIDYIGEDIEEIKTTQADIHSLAISINTLAGQVKRLVDDVCGIGGRVAMLEGHAGRRWESLVGTLLKTGAAGLAGYLLSQYLH